MSNHTAIHFCDERYREGLGDAQCRYDKLLCVIADLQGLKCGDSHIGYHAHIGIGVASDYDLQIHGFLLSPLCWLAAGEQRPK